MKKTNHSLVKCRRGGPGGAGVLIIFPILAVQFLAVAVPVGAIIAVIVIKIRASKDPSKRDIGIRPPRTSQKILLGIMFAILIAMLCYLATLKY